MKFWLATGLLFLLAVPYQTNWPDYETARRGLLACLVGLLILWPGSLPRSVPATVWPFTILALWWLARSLGVTNPGYALDASCYVLALAGLVIFGTGLTPQAVARAAVPTGLVVAAVGIAQGLGFSLLPETTEAVSTLGNRNVASELIAVCGAACAMLATESEISRRQRAFALATLLLCSAAVMINGSRSGMIALPLGTLPCLLRAGRWPALLALLVGLLLGFLVHRGEPSAAAAGSTTSLASSTSAVTATPSTVDVRLALWRGGMNMIAARPLIGHGGGQFPLENPLFRQREEIELSSYGRRFHTAPDSVHNDYLQVWIDAGLPAILLCGIAVFFVLRRSRLVSWGPLLAFAVLAGVRAPLTNAPTAALVFLYAGALLATQHRETNREISLAPQRQLVKGLVFGCLLLWFGGGQLLSQIAATGAVTARQDPTKQLASLNRALVFRPHDHDFRLMRAQINLQDPARIDDATALRAAQRDVDYLLETAPRDVLVQLRHAELLRAMRQPKEALRVIETLRKQDPHNLTAILWSAEIFVQFGESPTAIVVLYKNEHPRLREKLAAILGQLADAAATLQKPDDEALLRTEQAFVETLDQLAVHPAGLPAMKAWQRFAGRQAKSGHGKQDMRFLVLNAALQMAQDQRAEAESVAILAKGKVLLPTHRKMMEPVIQPLLDIPAWRELLGDE